jgi:hypothetical protein
MAICDQHDVVEAFRVGAALFEATPYRILSRLVLKSPVILSFQCGNVDPAVFAAGTEYFAGVRFEALRLQVG